jgi:hypothetical protein
MLSESKAKSILNRILMILVLSFLSLQGLRVIFESGIRGSRRVVESFVKEQNLGNQWQKYCDEKLLYVIKNHKTDVVIEGLCTNKGKE